MSHMSFKEYVDAAVSIRSEMLLEVSGTLEAIEELRAHLEQLETLLANRQYEEASAVGYNELSASFVYIQRCLGGVEELNLDEQVLVKDLARVRECSESDAQCYLDSEIGVMERT
jgi:hypothetical protein